MSGYNWDECIHVSINAINHFSFGSVQFFKFKGRDVLSSCGYMPEEGKGLV